MIKIFALIVSFNLFAIITGVSSPSSVNSVLKIQFKRFGIPKGGICTATAVSKTKILTAGHCVKKYLKHKPSFFKLKINSKSYSISSIDVLPNYSKFQQNYDFAISNNKPFANELKILSRIDVALITLTKKLSDNINITKLSLIDSAKGDAKLCGYGYSSYIDGKYSGNKSKLLLCGKNTYKSDSKYLFIKGNILNTSLSSSMTAPGDSGSPLFNTSGEQIGILSGITKDESGAATSYYVKLFAIKSFLQSHL